MNTIGNQLIFRRPQVLYYFLAYNTLRDLVIWISVHHEWNTVCRFYRDSFKTVRHDRILVRKGNKNTHTCPQDNNDVDASGHSPFSSSLSSLNWRYVDKLRNSLYLSFCFFEPITKQYRILRKNLFNIF